LGKRSGADFAGIYNIEIGERGGGGDVNKDFLSPNIV